MSERHLAISEKKSTFATELVRRGSIKQLHDGARLTESVKTKIQMYAIVSINGQQFKVEEGKKIFVHHIQNAESGQTFEFDNVLLVDKEGTISVGTPTVEGAKVVCEVKSPLVKGDKVIVFHMKRRKDSRKCNGHRQQFTELTIKQIIA